MTKYTPGPWVFWVWGYPADKSLWGLPASVGIPDNADRHDSGTVLLQFDRVEHAGLPREEQRANACLIKAAPALLEALEHTSFEACTKALKALRAYDDEVDSLSRLIGEALYEIEENEQKADAALRLARGESDAG